MADIPARMRQIIGTIEQWGDDDLVIGDGEFALERTDEGGIKIKVGNGVDVYTDLPYVSAAGAFGAGYTWRDVTGERNDNTNYTSPGHAIQISYRLSTLANGGIAEIVVGGISVATVANGGNGQLELSMSAIVPPDTIYRVNQSNANGRAWCECRAD